MFAYFFTIFFPQQISGCSSTQPHAVSTVTAKPQMAHSSFGFFFPTAFWPDFFTADVFFAGIAASLIG
jgi:hypothetical protein